MERPVRTILFGSGDFAVPTLRGLARRDDVDLALVVTAPPRPAGRDGSLRATPVADAADALGLPITTPPRLRDPAVVDALRDVAAALIVLADYGRLIPGAVLDLPPLGALNLHPSLLPRHRGASPIPAAILAGDTVTGVTLMRMDEGLDTGPIIDQRAVHLHGDEVAPALRARLADLAAELLLADLSAWLDGYLEARPQPSEGATLTRPLRRADGRLDPTRTAVELERQVRALQPWPGSFLELGGERLIVWASRALPGSVGGTPGSLVSAGDSLALVTAAGWLRLDEVQPAGKRRMAGADFARGRRGR